MGLFLFRLHLFLHLLLLLLRKNDGGHQSRDLAAASSPPSPPGTASWSRPPRPRATHPRRRTRRWMIRASATMSNCPGGRGAAVPRSRSGSGETAIGSCCCSAKTSSCCCCCRRRPGGAGRMAGGEEEQRSPRALLQ
ncbi:hypothetical protein F4778DRAFT_735544 [Xylariomycetidae sp. FL2044]|nr:hypothetical protein F4778DRAFT_735544 [Xylariomycetidae sp. FL2044]